MRHFLPVTVSDKSKRIVAHPVHAVKRSPLMGMPAVVCQHTLQSTPFDEPTTRHAFALPAGR